MWPAVRRTAAAVIHDASPIGCLLAASAALFGRLARVLVHPLVARVHREGHRGVGFGRAGTTPVYQPRDVLCAASSGTALPAASAGR